jgi:crotonobetainyl-CoA:carnitine CoA-transferase CaiB-like acyl-CoA transferase
MVNTSSSPPARRSRCTPRLVRRRATQAKTTAATTEPLAGLRVLDFLGLIDGSYCPMTLADFGADVIKVESPHGDAFRSFDFGPLGWNRGKRGLSVEAQVQV